VSPSTERHVLASDFHLSPEDPAGMEVFARFCADVGRGATSLFILGDLFEFWTGPKMLRDPAHRPVFEALAAVAGSGTEVVLFHGNRDFLLGEAEGDRAGGRVVGEELAVTLCGRRYLLLHGDSLCTLDVDYQKSKPILRSAGVRGLSRVLPLSAQLSIARRLRARSSRSVGSKPREVMEIVGAAARRRLGEGFDALICGHVHAPGARDYGEEGGGVAPVFVLGAWHGEGVYGEVSSDGVTLFRFHPNEGSVVFGDSGREGPLRPQ